MWKKERVTQVHTPLMRAVPRQRIAVVAAAVLGAGLLLAVASSAGAAPAPTITQVEKKIRQLQTKADQLGQQYDQVQQQMFSTKQQLTVVRRQLSVENGQFSQMRVQIASIAVAAYEDGNLNNSLTLLTAGNPQQILDQSSILQQLSASNNAEIGQFLAAARRLENTQEVENRTLAGIDELKKSLGQRKAVLNKMLSQQNTLLAQLTPAQQVALGGGSETGTAPVKYTGPTSSQADKAVQFAYDQLGCPYVYGGTGPCKDGFDCSGLTMESWAAAGVSIPRTSYEQWDDLPHVSLDDVQPGDILVFYDAGHVAIYVGHNQFIQAPQPTQDVQLVTYQGASTPGIDGAVVP
jgi:peptidoglycan DL-endopeptidase CwlO